MKVCPKCSTTTADDAQVYCLMDGTRLVPRVTSEPTVVLSPTEPTVTTDHPRKSRTGIWVIVSVLGVLIVGGLIGLLMYAAYRIGSESASIKVNANGNTLSPTPKPTTPKPTPQISPSAVPSQEPSPENSPDTGSSSGDPTPISWTSSASFVKGENGMRYSFECPPGGTPGTVWGNDPYTADSSVCTAAVHAGKITLDGGGTVTIEFTPGRQAYGATTRNGITTYNYGQYPHSIVFR